MNEIVVSVNQTPGQITWNFEEIKEALRAGLTEYKNTIYTDDTIKSAKTDVANLRKLAKTIEDRRKEVKEKCLEPYGIIEAQAKELTALIDEPIKAINEQVEDYEKRRKESVRAEILTYWQKSSGSIPEEIRDKVYQKNYDSRWENVTTTKKSWHEAIDKVIEDVTGAIQTIQSLKSEFEKDGVNTYYETLNLQKAIAKMNELKEQQERFRKMEEERRQREEQERLAREAAEKAAQEAQKEQEVQQTENTITAEPETPKKAYEVHEMAEVQKPEIKTTDPNADHSAQMQMYQQVTAPQDQTVRKTVRLEISGTVEQISKIQKYIAFTGAIFTEV